MAWIHFMPLDTNFALVNQSRRMDGQTHLKVIWLSLAYLYCYRERPISPMGIKGLLCQGNQLHELSEKLTRLGVPADRWLLLGVSIHSHIRLRGPRQQCQLCGIQSPGRTEAGYVRILQIQL